MRQLDQVEYKTMYQLYMRHIKTSWKAIEKPTRTRDLALVRAKIVAKKFIPGSVMFAVSELDICRHAIKRVTDDELYLDKLYATVSSNQPLETL